MFWKARKIQAVLAMALFVTLNSGILFPGMLHGDVLKPGKRIFLVTAYYSPLPGQSFYLTGSYDAERRLNGNGTNGADATEVYAGMLAAPSTYPFGTEILLPGLGVGTVHDRGGAILAFQDYDRIDVWMGQGEAGLARSLHFGKRLIEGEIVDAAVPESFDFSWLNTEIPSYVRNRQKMNPYGLTSGPQNKTSFRELQEGLRQFGYFHGEADGMMSAELREAILAFQLDTGILDSPFEAGAGNFGPKTQAKLQEKLERYNADIEAEKRYIRENLPLLQPGLGKKDSGEAVAYLQKMLRALGYYHGPIDGIYDSKTIESVFYFQTTYHVVTAESDPGAGYFGKQTHQTLIAAVGDRLAKLENLPQEKQVVLPATALWPSFSSVALGESELPQPARLHFELWQQG